MLFLTSSKVSDKGLPQLKGLKNLQVLALSKTQVTDAGLDALKDIKSLKSIYLIGTKVTPAGRREAQAVDARRGGLQVVAAGGANGSSSQTVAEALGRLLSRRASMTQVQPLKIMSMPTNRPITTKPGGRPLTPDHDPQNQVQDAAG